MQAQNTIQAGERNKVNLQLEQTQQLLYLVSIEQLELIACTKEPVAKPNPRQEQQAKPIEAAMWEAIDRLAQFS